MAGAADADASIRRALEQLGRDAEGVHELRTPAAVVDAGLPAALRAFYRHTDGAELYFGALVVVPAAEARALAGGRVAIGELDGDDLEIDPASGAVWRREADSGEAFEEATSFDRLLLGAIDAEALLVDRDGEFVGGIGEDGELELDTAIARERKRVKRDREAPAPRWRLARALVRAGEAEAARGELEALVAARPAFGWAWYDLARLAEAAGALGAARDDARAAAEADPDYEHAGFFWAHAARLGVRLGDAAGASTDAARALASDPGLGRAQRAAAEAQLDEGELAAAAELCAAAAALAPRDLTIADLARRIAAARASSGPPAPASTPSTDGAAVRGGAAVRAASGSRRRGPAGPRRRPRGRAR